MSRATKLMKVRRTSRRGWRRRRERSRVARASRTYFGEGDLFVIPLGGDPIRVGAITDFTYAYSYSEGTP